MPKLKTKRNGDRRFVKRAKSRGVLVSTCTNASTSTDCTGRDNPVTYFEIDRDSVRSLRMKLSSLRSLWNPSSEASK